MIAAFTFFGENDTHEFFEDDSLYDSKTVNASFNYGICIVVFVAQLWALTFGSLFILMIVKLVCGLCDCAEKIPDDCRKEVDSDGEVVETTILKSVVVNRPKPNINRP